MSGKRIFQILTIVFVVVLIALTIHIMMNTDRPKKANAGTSNIENIE